MSALSFKINAETDKLKSFITMLERLRHVLAEIPDSTKEFDVINRKIGEMEARVEQTMRKIAQMEQQAMDAASKAAASATTGTAGGNSTAGTAATRAETAAHHDLLSELKAANDEKTKAMAQIRLYSNEIARLKADVAALNKEEQQNGQLSAKKSIGRCRIYRGIQAGNIPIEAGACQPNQIGADCHRLNQRNVPGTYPYACGV